MDAKNALEAAANALNALGRKKQAKYIRRLNAGLLRFIEDAGLARPERRPTRQEATVLEPVAKTNRSGADNGYQHYSWATRDPPRA